MICGLLIAAVALVGVDFGERFNVVDDARCYRRKRFASVQLGTRVPVAEIVEPHVPRFRDSLTEPAEGLCQSVGLGGTQSCGVD